MLSPKADIRSGVPLSHCQAPRFPVNLPAMGDILYKDAREKSCQLHSAQQETALLSATKMQNRTACFSAMLCFFLVCGTATAQNVISTKAGVISFAAGAVSLDSNPVKLSKGSLFQMENGQRLKTQRGLAEVVLTPGAYLRLGGNSSVQMEQNQISEIQLSVESGSALIEIIDKIKTDPIRVHFQTSSAEIRKAGLYRFNYPPGEICVHGGEALMAVGGNNILIKSGKKFRMNIDQKPVRFSRSVKDSLHQWAALRSFDLFIAGSDTGKQLHWIDTALGWFCNSNYQMRFQSQKYLAQYMAKRRDQSIASTRPSITYSDPPATSTGSPNVPTSAPAPIVVIPNK
jgi:hypothetical protein